MTAEPFMSQRVSRTSTITLDAPLDEVFPLFGPVREKDWEAGWDPQILYSTTDLVEEHMVFKTSAHHGEADLVWTISKYQPGNAFIEYTVFIPHCLWTIAIQCAPGAADQTTTAEITYTFTGLTEEGNALAKKALHTMYAHDLQDWQEKINHYLETGQTLGAQKTYDTAVKSKPASGNLISDG